MSAEEGFLEPYALQWPMNSEGAAVQCYVLMKRQGGLLLALPSDFFAQDVLQAAQEDASSPLGPFTTLTVPAAQEIGGGEEIQAGFDMDVLVIDVQSDVLPFLTLLSQNVHQDVHPFFVEDVVYPEVGGTLKLAREWVFLQGGGIQNFYSAEEGPVSPKAPAPMKATAKKPPAEKAKRLSGPQQVAEHIKSLAELVPNIAMQLSAIQEEQARMRTEMETRASKPPMRASQMPVSMDMQNLGKVLGVPPRTKQVALLSPPPRRVAATQPMVDTNVPLEEQVEAAQEAAEGGTLAMAVLEQSRALTSLVSQLQSGDPLLDSHQSSFSTSSKGAQGRAQRKVRKLYAIHDAAGYEKDETGIPYSDFACSDCGVRLFDGKLLGKIRWLRQSKRAGNNPLCPLLCGGCSSQRRHCRSTGAPSSPLCSHRTGQHGSGPLGSCVPASSSGRSSCSAMDLQQSGESNVYRSVSCLCSPVSPEMGYNLVGFLEGVGLHPESKDRDGEEGATSPGGGSTEVTITPEEAKVPEGKGGRRRRPALRRCLEQSVDEADEHLDDELEVHGLLIAEEDTPLLEEQRRSGNGSIVDSSTGGSFQQDYEARSAGTEVGEGEFGKRLEVRPSSLYAWSRKLLKHVLAARTSFSYFVLQCLSQRDRRSFPVATALFPIPLPELDVWDGPCRFGSSRRRRAAFQRVLQLVVLSINFVHARDPWGSLKLMRRRPSSVHREVYARLMALIKAGGPVEDYSVIGSGRKSAQLDARHSEVLEILQSLGLSEASKYHSGAVGSTVPLVNDRDELVPYRPLNAERIKLTGSANWDCAPYLSDLFYMPFVEPRINMFDILPPVGSYPDVRGSDGQQEMALCLVWDARSLLHLVPEQCGPKHISSFTRVFGNFKNHTTDKQIGDRRGQNFKEGRISGPSRSLPVMTTLLQICPVAYEEVVVGSVTDRKDFYHQFQTTPERRSLNAIYPTFPLSAFSGTSAHESFVRDYGGRRRKEDRVLRGDHLGGPPRPILFEHEMEVVACFSALFQGDHLGVEFATDSHSNLLSEAGLLSSPSRLRSDIPIADDLVADGLVIDDYFVLSREGLHSIGGGSSSSVLALSIAKDTYAREGIIGSTEKDIVGALRYKVCGAEIDSSLDSVSRGVVSAAVPLDKRMSLAMLSASVATLPYTSDALHACLVGSWVSALMMRRPLFSVVNELFKVIPPESLSMDRPELRALPRPAAQELLLLSCLAPIAVSNLAAPFTGRIFATDASMEKGGVVEAPCSSEVVKAMWRGADRKGLSVPMTSSSSSLLEEYDEAYEILPSQDGYSFGQKEALTEAERPLGLYFDFIEICGGSGVVTAELIKFGVVCGPVFDLSLSRRYDMCDKRVVAWFLYMMEYGRLRSFLVAPPCTSFSPAAFPAVRSYDCPRGFDPWNPKVFLGNSLAFIALALLFAGLRLGVACRMEKVGAARGN